VRWEAYLARHFNHGATLAGIICGATGSSLPKTEAPRGRGELDRAIERLRGKAMQGP
jgi:hypothetical protein